MSSAQLIFVVAVVSCGITITSGDSYENKRCMCVCPSPAILVNATSLPADRIHVIANVPPNKCNCDGVILPKVGDQVKGREPEYCLRCECKYESRNTTIIAVVVIMVMFVIVLLTVYMGFLLCLDPLLNKRVKASYQEHTNQERQALLQTD